MIKRPVFSHVAGIFFITSICFILSASTLHAQAGISKTYHHAVVVSANSDASHAGIEVIRQGGNAVDAAVAVGFALAVTYPEAGNIGGGGFMVVRMSDGEMNTLDFREVAPFGASRTMYQNKDGDVVKGLSREGYLAVGVPGTVDGLVRAHAKYGKLPLKTDMEPAIELARKGYRLSYDQARVLNYYRDKFLLHASSTKYFVKPDSALWKEGELFQQKDLAKTLELIADKGRDGFYSGKTADLIVQQMKDGGVYVSRRFTYCLMDIGNIKASLSYITPELMDSLVDSILGANHVYILGTRASAPLAQFLSYYMSYFISNVKLVSFGKSDIYAQALYADKDDIVIGISFPRYSLLTVEGLKHFKSKGCTVVTITDNESAPPAEYSDYTLITKSNMNSFVDSLVAPLSLINVLIILLGLRKKNELVSNFEELERIWNQNAIYATQELDDKFMELSDK